MNVDALGPRSAEAMALIKPMQIEIVIRNNPPVKIDCPRGFLILKLKKIDIIQ